MYSIDCVGNIQTPKFGYHTKVQSPKTNPRAGNEIKSFTPGHLPFADHANITVGLQNWMLHSTLSWGVKLEAEVADSGA
jgi:hypothetical protein